MEMYAKVVKKALRRVHNSNTPETSSDTLESRVEEAALTGLPSDKRHKRRFDSSKTMGKARGAPCDIR